MPSDVTTALGSRRDFLIVTGGAAARRLAWRSSACPFSWRQLVKPFLLPSAGTLSFALGSLLLLVGNADGLYLMALGMFILNALGAQNARDYLFGRRVTGLTESK